MMESYQAIYDAVCSKIRNGDVGAAVESAVNAQIGSASFAIARLTEEYMTAAIEAQRPSVLYRPSISIDGNQWCALYGESLQDGVAGFGDTPADAMRAFDEAWNKDNARTMERAAWSRPSPTQAAG